MPDPYKPSVTDVPVDVGYTMDELVRRTAHAMNPEAAFPEAWDTRTATPAQRRADDLALLRAVEALHLELTTTAHGIAYRAGARTDAPVTYADLGEAVGITRQSARARWPLAIPGAKPGRPRTADPFPDLPLPAGVVADGEVYRDFGRPWTHRQIPSGLQIGDWIYLGKGERGAVPREVTGIEPGDSWRITTADGDRTLVRAMKDVYFIRPVRQET